LLHYKVKDGDQDNINEVTKHNRPSKAIWYLPIIPRFKIQLTLKTLYGMVG